MSRGFHVKLATKDFQIATANPLKAILIRQFYLDFATRQAFFLFPTDALGIALGWTGIANLMLAEVNRNHSHKQTLLDFLKMSTIIFQNFKIVAVI